MNQTQELDFAETPDVEPLVSVTLTVEDGWKSDPMRVIAGIQQSHRALEKWQRKAVRVAREQGATWDDIGTACGVSRQAAWERFKE
jgi:hypothetical protein